MKPQKLGSLDRFILGPHLYWELHLGGTGKLSEPYPGSLTVHGNLASRGSRFSQRFRSPQHSARCCDCEFYCDTGWNPIWNPMLQSYVVKWMSVENAGQVVFSPWFRSWFPSFNPIIDDWIAQAPPDSEWVPIQIAMNLAIPIRSQFIRSLLYLHWIFIFFMMYPDDIPYTISLLYPWYIHHSPIPSP